MAFRRGHDQGFQQLKEPQPLRKLFPNLITIAGLCCGMSAIRFALIDRWEICVAFLFAAALIDGLDGGAARLLRATSMFGAQLDSLSDFLCFGVAPALVIYMWQLEDIKRFGWAVVLFYAVCCALRLARFNTAIVEEKQASWEKRFFVGIPSPAAGVLILIPLMLAIESDMEFIISPWVIAVHMLVIGSLMVSRVPTFAAKNIRIPANYIVPVMLGCALLLVAMIVEPWKVLIFLGVAYLISIPFSCVLHRKLARSADHA